jgi:hypothetical protein
MLLAAFYCIRCTVRTLLEVFLVLLDVTRPLARDVRIRENRLDGTLRLTRTTIDAFVRMDVELIFGLINAIDRANLDATRVLRLDAWLGNDVGHIPRCPLESGSAQEAVDSGRTRQAS